MKLLQWAFANLGQVLILSVLIVMLCEKLFKPVPVRWGVSAVLLALCLFLPLHGLSLAQWLRSVIGDSSILTLLVLSNILLQRLFSRQLLQPASRQFLLMGIVVTGVILYPLALGWGSVDPYQWGYTAQWMGLLLILISLVLWLRGMHDLAVVLLLPLLAFNMQLLESHNLWDYFLDPVLLIYALLQSISFGKLFAALRVKLIG